MTITNFASNMTETTTFYRHVVREDYHFETHRGPDCVKAGTILLECPLAKNRYVLEEAYLAHSGKTYTYVLPKYVKVVKVTKTTTEIIVEDLD